MAGDSYDIAKLNFLAIEDTDYRRSAVCNTRSSFGAYFVRVGHDVSSAYEIPKDVRPLTGTVDWRPIHRVVRRRGKGVVEWRVGLSQVAISVSIVPKLRRGDAANKKQANLGTRN